MILGQVSDTETNCTSTTKKFSIEASPIAFEVLSSRLYSNPVLAIVRELLTNAYDAHIVANNIHTPIKLHFPTYEDPYFLIRDYGTGLCHNDILEMYTTFFSSSKNTSNELTGCFGLGSKTPFAYTPSFTVTSYFEGKKRIYATSLLKGYPHIICLNENNPADTNEHDGLEIRIDTQGVDNQFFHEVCNFLRYIPEILVDIDNENKIIKKPTIKHSYNNIKFYESNGNSQVYLKQGQNVYGIINLGINIGLYSTLSRIKSKNNIVIDVPIGTLNITPNRESLRNTEEDLDKIKLELQKAEEYLTRIMLDKEVALAIDGSLYYKALNASYKMPKGTLEITDTNKVVFSKDMLYFHRYEDSSTNVDMRITNLMNLEKSDQVILYHLGDLKQKDNQKIINILCNYNLNGVFTYKPEYWIPFMDKVKHIRKLNKGIKIANNSIELEHNIKLMSMKKFLKMYPNHRKQRIIKTEEDIEIYQTLKSLRYTYVQFKLNENRRIYQNKSTDSLTRIKGLFSPKNTLIVGFNEKYRMFNAARVLAIGAKKLKNSKNEYFILDYIKNLLPNFDINLPNIQILMVGTSNLKYFKEYVRLDIDDLINVIEEQDWKVCSIADNRTYDRISRIKETLIHRFSKREFKLIIEPSISYKALNYVLNSVCNNNSIKLSENEKYCFTELKINMEKRDRITNINIDSNIFFEPFKIFLNMRTIERKQTNNNNNNEKIRYYWVDIYALSKSEKTELLNNIRRKRNVVFH